jgi:cytochrome P450
MQQDVLQDLLCAFDRDANRGPVDVHHQMVRFTLRLVGRSLFGRSMTDAELDQIGDTISTIQAFIVRQIVQPYKIPWFRVTGQTEAHQRLRREADAVVLKHLQARLQQGLGDTDFLRILLETPYRDTGQPISEPQALIEGLQLMVAGNETSSNALTWTLYLLAQHPEYIHKVRDEVSKVIGGAAIDFQNLHRLELTMRVIHEALRLYPPFWMIDRIALCDDEVGGVHIPAGSLVIPYIYGIHRNPAHWQQVEAFDPGRFEADASRERHPFAYIPFGGGPRICIGNNLAVMQMLLIIVSLVRRYDFRLAGDRPVAIQPMMLLRPGGAVPMVFRAVS